MCWIAGQFTRMRFSFLFCVITIIAIFSYMHLATKMTMLLPTLSIHYQGFVVKKYAQSIRVNFYNKPHWVAKSAFQSCKYNCAMTLGEKGYRSATVVVFHGPDLPPSPPVKIPGQLWIMFGLEPPVYYKNSIKNWKDLFNWTMTYRRDSDITFPYGGMERSSRRSKQFLNWNAKDRFAAWFVSRCRANSMRERYVHQLQTMFDIHVYGRCGNYSCPIQEEGKCLDMLRKHYKYYLSFENSFCLDYITEKIFNVLQSDSFTIPVTRGQGNYSLFFPPGSYLSANRYKKLKDLAEEMMSTANSKEKFKQYFTWKKTKSFSNMDTNNLCELCEKMHDAAKYKRLYVSIEDWLNDKPRTACKSATDLL